MRIRLAAPEDAEAIVAIYAPYVEHSPATFDVQVPSVEDMRDAISARLPMFPWLIAEDDDRVRGYACATPHRQRAAYRWSVDVSIYLAPSLHRQGLGTTLYQNLFRLLRKQGYYAAYGGVTLPNDASEALHRRSGFRPIGVFPNAGYKLGGWHDVRWWALELQPPGSRTPDEPVPCDARWLAESQ